jgi:hypothetical protein
MLGPRTAEETSHFKVYRLYHLRCVLQPGFADVIRQHPDTWRRWGHAPALLLSWSCADACMPACLTEILLRPVAFLKAATEALKVATQALKVATEALKVATEALVMPRR